MTSGQNGFWSPHWCVELALTVRQGKGACREADIAEASGACSRPSREPVEGCACQSILRTTGTGAAGETHLAKTTCVACGAMDRRSDAVGWGADHDYSRDGTDSSGLARNPRSRN